jgi:hypothetical protein
MARLERQRRREVIEALSASDEVAGGLELGQRVGCRYGREQGDRPPTVCDLDGLARLHATEQFACPLSQLSHSHARHVLFVAHSAGFRPARTSNPIESVRRDSLPPTRCRDRHRGDGRILADVEDLVAPFFWIEGRDFDASASLEEMARSVEAYDVDYLHFMDARGTRLTATTKRYQVTGFLVAFDEASDGPKLEVTIRTFFQRIEPTHPEYAAEATRAEGLLDLVELYMRYKSRPPGVQDRLLRRRRQKPATEG